MRSANNQISKKQHFAKKEAAFMDKIKPFFEPGDSVLKIGNGFGFLSTYIAEQVAEIKVLEIAVFPETINPEMVELYDGKNIPVADKSYDVAVFNLVFHHIPNNLAFMRQVVGKTRRLVIVYEQTYDNFWQKLELVWRDWYVNLKAGTPCKIYWRSYFKRKNVIEKLESTGLKLVHRESIPSHAYFKDLLIFKVND